MLNTTCDINSNKMEEKSNTKKIVGAIVGLLVLLVLAILLLSQGNTHEVTFDSAGGSKVPTQKVKEGSRAKKPENPTKDGYEFVLWENNGVKYDFSEKVKEDITLKATWKEAIKKYKITFEVEGKEETLELEKLDEDVLAYLKFEDREGYEIRWYVGDEEYNFSTPLTEDIKLTGKYEATSSYTISFDTDGGGKIDSQTIAVGGKAKEPKAPTKRGYLFDGWYYNNNKFDFNATVKRSMKLVAHWKEDPNVKRFKVTFDSDGGTIIKEQTVIDGDKATKPATNPTKKGFTFVDWTLNDTVYNFSRPVTADITLKATWKEIVPMKVTFDSDGGSAVDMQEVDEGSKAKEPTPPTKDGYTFIEWRLNGKKYDFSKPVKTDLALKAYWEKKVKVTFDTDGGTPVPPTQTIDKGKTATKPSTDPKKDKYIFAEWQLNGKTYNFSTPVTGDITIKAKWEKDKEKYTVSFNLNGGTGNVPSQTVIEGYKATKPTTNPTRNGYVFVEWQLNNKAYDFNTVVKSNITLVAAWKKQHKVTFNSNGGSSVSAQTIVDGNKATEPTKPTRNGYVFVEWRLNGTKYNFNTAVTSDITLVAEWKKQHKVTFNSNGGSSVSAQTIVDGGKATKPSNPTRNGYRFVEWRLNGTAYNFSSEVHSDITLVAEWTERLTYTIQVRNASYAGSPGRLLTVYQHGASGDSAITIKSIKYTDGITLCTNGCKNSVDASEIEGETSFIVVLTSGEEVRASVES